MLQKVEGLKLPKAVKTGTTIVGLVFKVSGRKLMFSFTYLRLPEAYKKQVTFMIND